MIITIDGPTSSGKSSAARELADRLGYCHLNSGLFYRALAYLLIERAGYSVEELNNVSREDLDNYLSAGRLRYHCRPGGHGGVTFDGVDITPFLKSNGIGQGSSIISLDPYVRERLLDMQRSVGRHNNCVADGRDTGSVVFPNADIKFFLTAPLEVRAKRWQQDQRERGNTYSLDRALQEVAIRDERDQHRAVAPLIVPNDAVMIDNGEFTLEQTVEKMVGAIAMVKAQ